jgi:hypothetical protein
MENFNEELAIAEMAYAMRAHFGPRALAIAEEQARDAGTAAAGKAWRRIVLKLRRWDMAE